MIHEGYSGIIDVLSYSIGNFVNLFMGGLYNLFKIILLETDSSGNVIGLNFLGTCIFCVLGLIFTLWLISYLVTNLSFGQTKEDLPNYSDTEHEAYWSNVFNDSADKLRKTGSRMAFKLQNDNMNMLENKAEMKMLKTKYDYYNKRLNYSLEQQRKYQNKIKSNRSRRRRK